MLPVDVHQANTRMHVENLALPAKQVVLKEGVQATGQGLGLLGRAIADQQAELVAAESRQQITGSHLSCELAG